MRPPSPPPSASSFPVAVFLLCFLMLSTTVGNQCTFDECNTGYTWDSGSRTTRTCSVSGNTATWTGSSPTCKRERLSLHFRHTHTHTDTHIHTRPPNTPLGFVCSTAVTCPALSATNAQLSSACTSGTLCTWALGQPATPP